MATFLNILLFLITGVIVIYYLWEQHKKEQRYFNKKIQYTAKEKRILEKFKKEYSPIKPDARLATLTKDHWELEDIAKSAIEIVYDNPLPTNQEKQNLKPGDLVKLKFITSDHNEVDIERMWVRIEGMDNELYYGQLENEPYETDKLKLGQKIWFHPNHIFIIGKKSQA